MSIETGITNPEQLKEAIVLAQTATDKTTPSYFDVIWAIHKYKWYNWYLNVHIKCDSPADVENTKIFEALKVDHPKIHEDVEKNISHEVEKINLDIDD